MSIYDNINDYQPYCYLIGWSKLDKWYYGSEYANNKYRKANPNNLWKTYFTSSKVVKQMREYCGEPDIIQIRKIFDNLEDTTKWESKVLRRLHVVSQHKWLNLQCGDGKFRRHSSSIIITQSTREKLSKSNKGKKRTPEQNERNRLTHLGKKRTQESIDKQLASRKANYELKKSIDPNYKRPWNRTKQYTYNNSTRDKVRKRQSQIMKERYLNNPESFKGRVHTNATKYKLSQTKLFNNFLKNLNKLQNM